RSDLPDARACLLRSSSPTRRSSDLLLSMLGVAQQDLPRWAAGRDTAMITVILFSVWKNMGYYMVIYLAGLQGTNLERNEAAELRSEEHTSERQSRLERVCRLLLGQI